MNQSINSTQPSPGYSAQNSTSHVDTVNLGIGISIVVLPLLLVLSVIGYRRYRAKRLRQRIEALEKLWLLECKKKLS